MSIIHDALKKTEKTVNNPAEENDPNKPSPEVRAALKKKPLRKRIKTIFLYLFIAALGLFLGDRYFGYITTQVKSMFKSPVRIRPQPSPSAAGIASKPGPTLLENIPILPSRKKESRELKLNGVFFSQNEGFALINNRMVKVGDLVAGAKILKIELDEVELEQDGAVVKLSTK